LLQHPFKEEAGVGYSVTGTSRFLSIFELIFAFKKPAEFSSAGLFFSDRHLPKFVETIGMHSHFFNSSVLIFAGILQGFLPFGHVWYNRLD
jgi:hypothetical protein